MKTKSPWAWVPTLYLLEGIPYALVNTLALAVFKDLGVDNGTLGPLTTLISLPWLVKPLWSPLVDIFRSKRWWILLTQITMAATALLIALLLPFCGMTALIILFVIVAFASATHDISADGYYMLGLDREKQSVFVGIRNTFYRGGLVFGQGLLVMLAGLLQQRHGSIPRAWATVMGIAAALMALIALYHVFTLPSPEEDHDRRETRSVRQVFSEFGASFATFFTKPTVGWAIAFLLLYRLPEALSLNLLYPFFKDGPEVGGLGAGTSMYGLVYGTFGVFALRGVRRPPRAAPLALADGPRARPPLRRVPADGPVPPGRRVDHRRLRGAGPVRLRIRLHRLHLIHDAICGRSAQDLALRPLHRLHVAVDEASGPRGRLHPAGGRLCRLLHHRDGQLPRHGGRRPDRPSQNTPGK